MKTLIALGCILLSFSGTILASELQMLEGDEAYQTYLNLPGVACQEYKLENYLVMSKYQTKNCSEIQKDPSKWNCTVQFRLKNGKRAEVLTASCSREI
jgi:hypothetical protein